MIHIALNGQIYNGSGIVYTYPDKIMYGEYPDWIRLLPDSRFLRDLCLGDSCFSIRNGAEGLSYAYTTLNTADSRGGCAMISLFMEKQMAVDGSKINLVLRKLLSYFLSLTNSAEISNQTVEEILNELNGTLYDVSDMFPSWHPINEKSAVRIYETSAELNNILANSLQNEHWGYRWVHLLEGSKYKSSQQQYPLLKVALNELYFIDEGNVCASKRCAHFGEEIKLTYDGGTKGRFSTKIKVGTDTTYSRLEGRFLRILQEGEVIISYEKKVRLQITNVAQKEKLITIYDGKEKTTTITTEDVYDVNLPSPIKSCKVKVQVQGYKDKEIDITSDKECVTIPMEEQLMDVRLQMNVKGEPVKENIKIGSASQLIKPIFDLSTKLTDSKYLFIKIDPWRCIPLCAKHIVMIVAVLFILMLSSIGCAIYWMNHKERGQQSLEEVVKERDNYKNKVDSLNNVILQQDKFIISLNSKIRELRRDSIKHTSPRETSRKGGVNANATSSRIDENKDTEALKFLNNPENNDKWCVKNVKGSKYEAFMISLLEGSSDFHFLDKQYNDITNSTWRDIKKGIEDKRKYNPDDALSALKNVRLDGEKSLPRSDKTMRLSRLKKEF